jgi:hypothetical protein
MILDYWLWGLFGNVSASPVWCLDVVVACSRSPWLVWCLLGLAPGRSDCLHLLDVLVLIKACSKFLTVNYPLLFNAFVWMETGGSFFKSVVVLASLLGSHIIAAVLHMCKWFHVITFNGKAKHKSDGQKRRA